MIIKPGEYRTRSGERAVVVAVEQPFAKSIIGYIDGHGYKCWYSAGAVHEDFDSENDLVAEWREPVKVAGWVNFYKHAVSGVYDTKKYADDACDDNRIACVYVSGTEGVEP